jgi:uncharacterized protein (DUF2141 family)
LKKLLSYILVILFIPQVLVHTGCANIIPPGGGPKDSLPPRLVRASPKDSVTNFTGNKIELVFNEFIELDNVSQEIILSPLTKYNPQVERKLNVITVKFKDTLEANTTYSVNFGNAIKDLNEGNKAPMFTYVFSTGSSIDSYSIAGKVFDAKTGKVDSTVIVTLYKNPDDSAVIKERPRYFTRLNGKGEFTFRNLPAGAFNIYALKDDNGNRQYDSKAELFAFANELINTTGSNKNITLFAFAEEEQKPPAGAIAQAKKTVAKTAVDKLRISGSNLEGPRADLLKDLEIVFNNPIRKFDSTGLLLTDEKFNPVKNYSAQPDTSGKKIILRWDKTENTSYKLILKKDFATDTANSSYSKTDTISFITRKEAEYGSFRIRFANLAKFSNPVLQLVNGDHIAAAYKLTGNELEIKMFFPGSYELRILEDLNNNGLWDTGHYSQKKQPEKVTLLGNKLEVKPAWDKELIINL